MGATQDTPATPGAVRRSPGVLLLCLVVAAGVLGALWVAGVPVLGVGGAKMQTADRVEQMVQDAERELGTTRVVEASLYDSYAMVTVPFEGSSTRTITYRYAGDFDDEWARSTRTDDTTQLIDLADLDAAAVLARLDDAPADVGLPDGDVLGVTIRLATVPEGDSGQSTIAKPSVFISVDSEFGESGSLQLDLAGQVLRVDRAGD